MQLINKYSKFPQNKFTTKVLATGDPFRYDIQWWQTRRFKSQWHPLQLKISFTLSFIWIQTRTSFFLSHWSYFKYRNEKREEWMPALSWSSWMWMTTQPGENKLFIFVFHKSFYSRSLSAFLSSSLSSFLLDFGESHFPVSVSHIPPILTTVLTQMPCYINKHL